MDICVHDISINNGDIKANNTNHLKKITVGTFQAAVCMFKIFME
jgi:hypothetical protein